MKKILIAIFAVVVTAAWVLPAMAVDATFGAQYRVRAITVDNLYDLDNNATDTSSWIDQRFRLGITLKEAPVMGYLQLQMGGGGANGSKVWGVATDTTVTDASVVVRQAWLDFPVGPVGIRLGRTYASHGFLGGGMFENIADRIILTYKVSDELTTSFIHAKARESNALAGTNTANDNDRNIYNLGGTYKMGDMGDVGARVYYVTDGLNYLSQTGATTAGGDTSAWWATAQANLKFDPIKVYVSGAYLTGKSNRAASGATAAESYDLTGYAVHGDVNASFGQASVGVVAGMGSGDSDTTDKKLNTFFAPGGSSYIQSILFFQDGENNYSIGSVGRGTGNLQNGALGGGGNNATLSNVTWAGLYGSYTVSDDLSLSAKYAMFQQTVALTTTGTPTKSTDIGKEIDLIASYKLHKDLTLLAAIAQFTPGDAYTGKDVTATAKSDTISAYYARLQWEF